MVKKRKKRAKQILKDKPKIVHPQVDHFKTQKKLRADEG